MSGEVVCSTENVVVVRDPGRERFQNVTQQLTSLNVCYDSNADPTITDIDCFRYVLFRDEFMAGRWPRRSSASRTRRCRRWSRSSPRP